MRMNPDMDDDEKGWVWFYIFLMWYKAVHDVPTIIGQTGMFAWCVAFHG